MLLSTITFLDKLVFASKIDFTKHLDFVEEFQDNLGEYEASLLTAKFKNKTTKETTNTGSIF